jgi:F-type H+-transporting ATPase subunit epsilon
MTIKLDIVTVEKVIFSDYVDIVVAPGLDGVMGVLPHHAPLMTTLKAGELVARQGSQEFSIAVSGGFMEVRPDRVIVLADSAERAEDIDIARAEEAKRKAQEQLAHPEAGASTASAEAALRRALARIEVADRRKKRKSL